MCCVLSPYCCSGGDGSSHVEGSGGGGSDEDDDGSGELGRCGKAVECKKCV